MNSFIYLFIYSLIHLFIYSFIYSFILIPFILILALKTSMKLMQLERSNVILNIMIHIWSTLEIIMQFKKQQQQPY